MKSLHAWTKYLCVGVICATTTLGGCAQRPDARDFCTAAFQRVVGQTITIRAHLLPAGGSMESYFLTNADCAKRVSIPASGLPTDFLKKYMVKFANATHLIAVEGDFTIRIEWTDSFIAVGRVLLVENEKLVDFDYDQSKV